MTIIIIIVIKIHVKINKQKLIYHDTSDKIKKNQTTVKYKIKNCKFCQWFCIISKF